MTILACLLVMTDEPCRDGVGTKPELIWGAYRAAATPGSIAMQPQYSLSGRSSRSNQLEALEAGVALFADDDVVVDGDAQRPGGIDDLLGHVDVGARRYRIT